MLVCRKCNVYTLKATCPECDSPTVEAYGSASRHKQGSGLPLSRLVKAYPPPGNRPVERVVRDIEPRGAAYGLVHTLGRARYDEFGGDGAYARWMQRYFSGMDESTGGCVHAAEIRYDGDVGNIKDSQIARQFNPKFLPKFKALVDSDVFERTSVIILNWHIRFTNGPPNGYTGRGINAALVRRLCELCEAAGKTLGIVYTIHEASDLRAKLHAPAALVPLNPAVNRNLAGQFPDLERFQSRVPGLLTSTHTLAIDQVLRMLGEYVSSVDLQSPSGKLYLACAQQQIRLRNADPDSDSTVLKGIVIFGMIMPRHGLSVAVVENLAKEMNRRGLPAELKIVIAGKESDAELVEALKGLGKSNPRVRYLGHLTSFRQVAGCRYAISFDALGYRDNASAMVNVVREGHLLFSRRGAEDDDALIARAVDMMAKCERHDGLWLELLAAHQPRIRRTAPEEVGANLDKFFRRVATRLLTE